MADDDLAAIARSALLGAAAFEMVTVLAVELRRQRALSDDALSQLSDFLFEIERLFDPGSPEQSVVARSRRSLE